MGNILVKKSSKINKLTWLDKNKRYLKENYHLQSLEELAKYFGKTPTQIQNQAQRQHLSKRVKN